MDINKGLFLDGYVTDKPHGGWEYAKNILLADGFKSVRNEKGFTELVSGDDLLDVLAALAIQTFNTAKIVGQEVVKDYIILFVYAYSTSAGQDACCILKYDIIADSYEMILEENGNNFYFHSDYVVDSMHTFTPDGDLIIAFCNGSDDVCIEPILMNVDRRYEFYLNPNSSIIYMDLLYLFNRTDHIIEDYAIIDDGELDAGVYYVTGRFEYADGTKSNWSMLTQPMKIGANPDKITGAAITIKGSYSGNFAYKAIDIAYIRKFKGKVFAYEYGNFAITSAYSGGTYTYKFDVTIVSNTGTLVDLDSILVRKAFYRKAKTIDFVDNKVHLGGIKEENLFLNYQNFANDIMLTHDVVLTHKDDGSRLTFAPGEVYAFYIYFILKGSGIIALPFNIPGREDYFADDVNFKDFEDDVTGNLSFPVNGPTITTTLDYTDFPSGKYIKVDLVSYHNGGAEEVFVVTAGILNDGSFIANLSAAMTTLFTAETILVSVNSTTATEILLDHTDTAQNGIHFRYVISDTLGGTDITNAYNDVIAINN